MLAGLFLLGEVEVLQLPHPDIAVAHQVARRVDEVDPVAPSPIGSAMVVGFTLENEIASE